MGLKGQAQAGGNYERTIFPEGVYTMTLTKALVMWGKPSQYAPEGSPKIGVVWKWIDEDGGEFELMDFLSFPKNFGYNDKSKFWKRVSEIAGVTITKDNVGDVDMDLGEFIHSYEELIEHIQSKNAQGNNEKAEVKSLSVNGQELMGKTCQLVVKVWTAEGGKEGNEVASVMQVGASQGPRRPQKATPAAAPAQQQPLVSAPPGKPRTNTTEPLHAEEVPY